MKIIKSRLVEAAEKEVAMPYRSQGTYKPAWAKTEETNSKELLKLLPESKIVARYRDLDIHLHKYSADVDFYFVHENDLIQYGVRVIHYKITGKLVRSTCGQVSVWRNQLDKATVGLPKWMFASFLKEIYGCIVSDKVQSTEGETFWDHRIDEALMSGKKVYVLDIEEKHHTLQVEDFATLETTRDMNKYYTEDQDYSGERFRFLIT